MHGRESENLNDNNISERKKKIWGKVRSIDRWKSRSQELKFPFPFSGEMQKLRSSSFGRADYTPESEVVWISDECRALCTETHLVLFLIPSGPLEWTLFWVTIWTCFLHLEHQTMQQENWTKSRKKHLFPFFSFVLLLFLLFPRSSRLSNTQHLLI